MVKGKDNTPPQIKWVNTAGKNLIQVRVFDGSKIQSVKAMLVSKDKSPKSFEIELRDDGQAGDVAEGDAVFSKKIPELTFGLYNVTVEATDAFGNKKTEASPGEVVLY